MSLAPPPPHLRPAKAGSNMYCGSCKMFDRTQGVCWGYGNYPVDPIDVCDSWAPDEVQPDEEDVKGDNLKDGSTSAGDAGAPGLTDGTGSLSSTEPTEEREVADAGEITLKIELSDEVRELLGHEVANDTQEDEVTDEVETVETDEVETEEVVEDSEEAREDETETEERDAPEDEVDEEAEVDEVAEPEEEPRDSEEAPEPPRRYKARHKSTPSPQPEVRIRVTGMELRSVDGSTAILRGTPVVFNTPYDVYDMMGRFSERMAETVVDDIIDTVDCRFLFNHDGMPLARTLSGTLVVSRDSEGVHSEAHVDMRQNLANDLVIATERGDVSQMSVGFVVAEDHWDSDFMNRTVVRYADMPDVSAVTYPASPTTSIAVAQRMMMQLPLQTRARVREAYKAARDMRAGKVLNATNSALIAAALEAMHRADSVNLEQIVDDLQSVDDALDVGMAALSGVSGLPNPDDDDADTGPVSDEGEGIRESDEEREEREAAEAEAAEAERLERERELEQAAEERKRAAAKASAELAKLKRRR